MAELGGGDKIWSQVIKNQEGLDVSIHSLEKKRVLVVEDDIWMKPLITKALKSAIQTVDIDWVSSAEEAFKKAHAGRYDVIISDIYLDPGQETGIGFWEYCQKQCPETPILLTSSIPVDSFARSMEGSVVHYLPKPFDVNQCKIVIESMLGAGNLSS